jgi:hypothetical protein
MEQKQSLDSKLQQLNDAKLLEDSNYKFIVMLQSRLIENDIPPNIATAIAAFADFDMSAFNEESDYISNVALTYAEFCAKIYFRLKSVGFHQYVDARTIQKFFNPNGTIAP